MVLPLLLTGGVVGLVLTFIYGLFQIDYTPIKWIVLGALAVTTIIGVSKLIPLEGAVGFAIYSIIGLGAIVALWQFFIPSVVIPVAIGAVVLLWILKLGGIGSG